LRKINVGIVSAFFGLAITHTAVAAPSQDPLFLSNPVVPLMMLNMSKDHQLYYKVYDDYADLDGDQIPELTYKHSYEYYGYFDSKKCYEYKTNRFEPVSAVDSTTKYCSDKWSGNFLNWATMTRMDSIRKILYGGLRSTDTATETVLERAFLPQDAHSFAKYYNGSTDELEGVTPFKATDVTGKWTRKIGDVNIDINSPGFTICNTTAGTGLSQSVTTPPLMRMAKGNHIFWASNERWQCKWESEITDGSTRGVNGNDYTYTSTEAYFDSPLDTNKLKIGGLSDLNVRVKVCVDDLEESNCYKYPKSDHEKPQGLLQEFGEIRNEAVSSKINFGLFTGSYQKNKSGGVLRKAMGNMMSEVNADTDGTFRKNTDGTAVDGVIKTLNLLRPYGYSYSGNGEDGSYNSSDSCQWGKSSFTNGICTNWGNPQAEIYLESLRYLAGKSANTAFTIVGDDKIPGLIASAWGSAPVTEKNYCAPLNVLQFNASATSYDGDDLTTASDIVGSTAGALDEWTNKIASSDHENLSGKYFVGFTGASGESTEGLCSAKDFTSLSAILGTCPDAPRLSGSYGIAGLAYYARTNDLLPLVPKTQTVRTFGVALAPALPKVEIVTPDKTKSVTILPACKNLNTNGNCAIVDFKILSQSYTATLSSGLLYVNWEDSEQGGDYDQDMWGIIKYAITDTEATITTKVVSESTGDKMGFGYVISGTYKDDGPHFHSGIESFNKYECETKACNVSDKEAGKTYTLGSSTAKFLETPLYYAAKWGGFTDALVERVLGKTAYDPEKRLEHYEDAKVLAELKKQKVADLESYYFATDPRKLEESLRSAFRDVAKAIGSASAVATNSTRLSEGAYIFQAQFNSEDWSGELNVFEFNKDGELPTKPSFSTQDSGAIPAPDDRIVYTYNGTNLVKFAWDNLTDDLITGQQIALRLPGEVDENNAKKRVEWLRGSADNEVPKGSLRNRGADDDRVILGDIVNSSPAYVGAWDFRYNRLPVGGSIYSDFVKLKREKTPRIFVGANDGAVHAFQVPSGSGIPFKELYAYIPNLAIPKLALLTEANYGTRENPHQFLVDGPITVGDVYIGGSWRTIIVGTMGAGGRGVYALDVTDDVPEVLWELSEKDYPQLGYVMGKPLIVPMKNNRWAAVFGNGSESEGNSSLFVVDIEAPMSSSYTRVLDVGEGAGLSAPALLPNVIGQVEVAYAGDLSGNLWRFDLSDDSASSWGADTKKNYRLFTATDSNSSGGNIQPISAAPTLGLNALKDNVVMVYFGTGKYFDVGDNSGAATPIHSFYAIADIGEEVARSSLFKKTLDTDTETVNTRKVVEDTEPVKSPDWPTAGVNGWRLDFDDTNGERVTTKALLLQDWLIFPTLIPSSSSCNYGGRSWLMAVMAVGDKAKGNPPPIDNLLNSFLVLGDLGFGQLGEAGKGAIVGSGTDATLLNIKAEYDSGAEGRQSWRQLQ
jgi:type IV pilus assembly protein PilY1